MKISHLLEAPLGGVEYHRAPKRGPEGERNEGSYSEQDRKIIKKFMKDKTYKVKLQKFPSKLYVYFIDDEALKHYGKDFPEGEVQLHDLENFKYHQRDTTGARGEEIDLEYPAIVDKIKERLSKEQFSTHLIMGDNHSDTHQMAPTPWIIAHRLLHALYKVSTSFQDAMRMGDELYQDIYNFVGKDKALALSCFTFASARNHKVALGELPLEMATQVAITGKLTLDLKNIPTEHHEAVNKAVDRLDNKLFYSMDNNIPGSIYYI